MIVLSVIGAIWLAMSLWLYLIYILDTKGPIMKYALAIAAGLMLIYAALNLWVL